MGGRATLVVILAIVAPSSLACGLRRASPPVAAAGSEASLAYDLPLGTATVVVRRFRGLKLDDCLATLKPAEGADVSGEKSKPEAAGASVYTCFIRPEGVPKGPVAIIGNLRGLELEPAPTLALQGPEPCDVRSRVEPHGVRFGVRVGGAVVPKAVAAACLARFWKSKHVEDSIFEKPMLRVIEEPQ